MATFLLPSRSTDGNSDTSPGALCYVYLANTTTPADLYYDEGMTTPHSHPIVYDSAGAPPPAYAADGTYKVDLQDAEGSSLPGFPKDDIEIVAIGDRLSAVEGISDVFVDDVVAVLALTGTYAYGDTILTLKENFSYEVAASEATDYHIQTAGGLLLYALPDAEGVITTEQLGWSDGDDVTDALIRFWDRFNEGETFEFAHNVNVGCVFLRMPTNFTMRAREKKVHGINFTSDAWSTTSDWGKFTLYDHCKVEGMRFTSDLVAEESGLIFNGGDVAVPDGLVGVKIHDCYFDVPVSLPLRIYSSLNLHIARCEFYDGQYFLSINQSNRLVMEDCVFDSTNAIYPNHEHIKFNSGSQERENILGLVTRCNFIRPARDGIDTTGGLQDFVISHCYFEGCGDGGNNVSGVGLGGVDFKTINEESTDPGLRSFNVVVAYNIFSDSRVALTGNWGNEGGSWTDPTPEEVLKYGQSEFRLISNFFIKTSAYSTRAGFGNGLQNGNVSLDGDTFLGGATVQGNGSLTTGRDLYLELTDINTDMLDFEDEKNLDLHFRMIETREPFAGTGNYIKVKDCSNVKLSGNLNIKHEGMSRFIQMEGLNEDVSITFDAEYSGGGSAPIFVYLIQVVPRDGLTHHDNIRVQDCTVEGFTNLFQIKGDTTQDSPTNIAVMRNRYLAGYGGAALVDFMTLTSKSDVDGIKIIGNEGDGTTALWEGDTADLTFGDIADNRNFTGSPAITVADLPTGYVGQRMWVSDADTTVFNAALAGSGSDTIEARFNGTNWVVA